MILQWNADQVTDPRSGKVVCHVEPATFCTQCFVTHTPVWRAGPFGETTQPAQQGAALGGACADLVPHEPADV